MTSAENIVDALIEGVNPKKFMQDYGKRWHADYYRDDTGWYHVNWLRGFDVMESDDLKLSKAQIEWLAEYANWLDAGTFPFNEFMDGRDKLHSRVSSWFEAAQQEGFTRRYIKAGHPMPPIDERGIGESDMDAFVTAAIAPMLQSWATETSHGSYVWSTRTAVNKEAAVFELVITPDMQVTDSKLPREAVSLKCGLSVEDGYADGHWFGFTYGDEAGHQHVFTGIYKATIAMTPALRVPVKWKRREALWTAAQDRLMLMQSTVIQHVLTPEAKALGITYYVGAPKAEDEAPGAYLYR